MKQPQRCSAGRSEVCGIIVCASQKRRKACNQSSGSSAVLSKRVKSVGQTFLIPKFEVPGLVQRDNVPGWKERAPTVPPPAPTPMLPAASVATIPAQAAPQGTGQGVDQVRASQGQAPRNKAR